MRFLSIFYVLLGLLLSYIGAIGLIFVGVQSARIPMDGMLEFTLYATSGLVITIGSVIICIGALGVVAAHREDLKLLKIYRASSMVLALLIGATAICGILFGTGFLDTFVDDNCRPLVQLGADEWFKASRGTGPGSATSQPSP